MSKAVTSNNPAVPASFEAALAELESIVHTMEQGNAPLETALAAYERGTTLLRYCQETLGNADQKIRLLEGATLKCFDPVGDADD